MIKKYHRFISSKKTIFLLAGLLSVSLFSCDPVQSINLENKTDSEAMIKIGFSDDIDEYVFEERLGSDTLKVTLNATATRNYHFGMGHWKIDGVMEKLAKSVVYVEMNSKNGKEIYQGEAQIMEFFKNRISSSDKSRINIVFE